MVEEPVLWGVSLKKGSYQNKVVQLFQPSISAGTDHLLLFLVNTKSSDAYVVARLRILTILIQAYLPRIYLLRRVLSL